MAEHRVLTSDQDIERASLEAAPLLGEPRLKDVRLARVDGEALLVLVMDDESRHYLPTARLEGLGNASDDAVSRFEISEDGLGLSWPGLDVDLFVPALLQGVYGTEKWMTSLGRLGGSARSEAKTRAARENGRKGGRPRKKDGSYPCAKDAPIALASQCRAGLWTEHTRTRFEALRSALLAAPQQSRIRGPLWTRRGN